MLHKVKGLFTKKQKVNIIEGVKIHNTRPDMKVLSMTSEMFSVYLEERLNKYDETIRKINECVKSCKKVFKCDKPLPSLVKYKLQKAKYDARQKACNTTTEQSEFIDNVIIPCLKNAGQDKTCSSVRQYNEYIKQSNEEIPKIIKDWVKLYDNKRDTSDDKMEILNIQLNRADDLFPNDNLTEQIGIHLTNLINYEQPKSLSTPLKQYAIASTPKTKPPMRVSLTPHLKTPMRVSLTPRLKTPTRRLVPKTPSLTKRETRFIRRRTI